MNDSEPRVRRPSRTDSREAIELRAIRERMPELADAVDLHLELLELHRRIQGRVPLPWFELDEQLMTRHQAEGRPLLRFEAIPLELTDLRLMVRQVTDLLRRHGALEPADFESIQVLGRDLALLTVARDWYRAKAERPGPPGSPPPSPAEAIDTAVLDQVFTLAMRPFLSRCAEVLQPRPYLTTWTHPHCPLCGGEPDFAVITPAAERHLICGRCTLQWRFEPLACPYCGNGDKARITSFATPDGQYRVYACNVCRRYLKAYDARRAARPVMPMVDIVGTLPLDAAAIQRGYSA